MRLFRTAPGVYARPRLTPARAMQEGETRSNPAVGCGQAAVRLRDAADGERCAHADDPSHGVGLIAVRNLGQTIVKRPSTGPAPNMADYDEACARFSWTAA